MPPYAPVLQSPRPTSFFASVPSRPAFFQLGVFTFWDPYSSPPPQEHPLQRHTFSRHKYSTDLIDLSSARRRRYVSSRDVTTALDQTPVTRIVAAPPRDL